MDFNYVGASFIPVGVNKENMTLGDLSANEDFFDSTIQFWTNSGANKKVTIDTSKNPEVKYSLENVDATYLYWSNPEWTAAKVAGWYLKADEDAWYPQNDVQIPFGTGFIVNRYGNEIEATVNMAGEVTSAPQAVGSFNLDFNYVSSCCPRDITLGEITANEDFFDSTIQFWTNSGANKKVTIDTSKNPEVKYSLENVDATYLYWSNPEWTAAKVAGWYLKADEDAWYPQNDVQIPFGTGFIVNRYGNEIEAAVSLPAAL